MIHNPTTINASAQPPLAGNVVLAAGTNVTLTQTGNQISIAAAGGAGGNFPLVKNSTDIAETLTITAGFQFICARTFANRGTVINRGDFILL